MTNSFVWRRPLTHRPRILDYVHTASFSLGFCIVLRPQGIRKQFVDIGSLSVYDLQ